MTKFGLFLSPYITHFNVQIHISAIMSLLRVCMCLGWGVGGEEIMS